MKPDFSEVLDAAAAQALVARGELVEIRFFPTELGGPEDPLNIGYVTPEAADEQEEVIDALIERFEQGQLEMMDVQPDYRGLSIVPTRIRMKAWHRAKPNRYERVIEVW